LDGTAGHAERHATAGADAATADARAAEGRAADILSLFKNYAELSAADIIQATRLSRASVLRYLAQLVEEGQLIATAPPSSHHRTYRLP
jgi:DNA-binding IclR family transcriptional regulator